jgi:hypothetical protein
MNGPYEVVEEMFPDGSIAATWNQKVPNVEVLVVVAVVVETPGVVAVRIVFAELSQRYKYVIAGESTSVESNQEMPTEVTIVPVAAVVVEISGVDGAVVSVEVPATTFTILVAVATFPAVSVAE